MTTKALMRATAALSLCVGAAWSTTGWAGSVATALQKEGASTGVINAGTQIQNLCTAMRAAGYGAPTAGAGTATGTATGASVAATTGDHGCQMPSGLSTQYGCMVKIPGCR